MPKDEELKLCPNCPAYAWIPDIKAELRRRQARYTNQIVEPSPLRVCLELRMKMKELGLKEQCPYFYTNETIMNYTMIKVEQHNEPKPIQALEAPLPSECPFRILTVQKQKRQTLILERKNIKR